MINEKMYELGSKSSEIRELFSYGLQRKAEVGEENVYDFSLGNPSIPAPSILKDTILELMEENPEVLHGYSPAQGDSKARDELATAFNKKFHTNISRDNLYLTVGAAASLDITLQALINPGDEVIVFAPFFPEYKVWVEYVHGIVQIVNPHLPDFQIDLKSLEDTITPDTKAVIINSPNNPSGVVYSEETIKGMADILEKKQNEYGSAIYLITDEPYREIVYDDVKVPYVPEYYTNTIVCYSYSKSLSVPGERIGYIMVPDQVMDSKRLYLAVCGAGRAMGYVCAPVLFQKAVAKCADLTSDIAQYEKNRNKLYQGLVDIGFSCVKPQGAFYLFVKAPDGDGKKLSQIAKEHDVLIVPSDSFGVSGYVRISYCVDEDIIDRAIPQFENIMKHYQQ